MSTHNVGTVKIQSPQYSKGEGEEKKLTKSTCSKSATQELASHL